MQDIASPAVERNTGAIAFRPISRLSLREVASERLGLLKAWQSAEDGEFKQRVGQRLIALNRAQFGERAA